MSQGNLQESLRNRITIPNVSAAAFLLLTLVTSGRYGFYGDELYYFACSKHLAWGYVDHPPLVALLTFIGTRIFGENIFGLRFLSGLAGAVTVMLSAKIAQMLGGGKLSQALAALSICFAIAFPAISSFFSMNPVDIMLCTMFIYLFAKTIEAPYPQKWITLGVLFGVGLLNKYTFLGTWIFAAAFSHHNQAMECLEIVLDVCRRCHWSHNVFASRNVAGRSRLAYTRIYAQCSGVQKPFFVASCILISADHRIESIHTPAVAVRIDLPAFQQGNERT